MTDEAVRVIGWPELAAGTAKLADSVSTQAQAQFANVAAHVAGQVAGRVPHLTGRLAGSAIGQPGPPPVVGLGDGVPYAGWIEFGGTRSRPYVPDGRYLYPTAQAAEPLLVAAGGLAADTEVKGMTWPKPK